MTDELFVTCRAYFRFSFHGEANFRMRHRIVLNDRHSGSQEVNTKFPGILVLVRKYFAHPSLELDAIPI